MTNPNVKPPHRGSVTVRRHKTLPGPLRSIRPISRRKRTTTFPTKNTLHKSNPYVGWFRHAPAVSDIFLETVYKKRRYISKHCQIIKDGKKHTLLVQLQHHHKYMEPQTSTGYLRGGAREEEAIVATTVVSRIAHWLLDVPLTEDHHHRFCDQKVLVLDHTDSASLSSSDDDASETESRDEEDDMGSSSRTSRQMARSLLSESRPRSHSSLDYDISQMDIVRMNRVASRHLDVDSIVQLPIITYGQTTTNSSSSTPGNGQEETPDPDNNNNEFSWMLVPEPPHMVDSETEQEQQQDVCVICLEHFLDGDRLRVLPCSHKFHVGCIDRWLSGSLSYDDCYTSGCPTCKKRPNCDTALSDSAALPSWAFKNIGHSMMLQEYPSSPEG